MNSGKRKIWLIAGIVLFCIGLFQLWREAGTPAEKTFQYVESRITHDLAKELAAVEKAANEALKLGELSYINQQFPGISWVKYDSSGYPSLWGRPSRLPTSKGLASAWQFENSATIEDKNARWYALLLGTPEERLIVFYPLYYHYPVRNQIFQDLIFMGRYGQALTHDAMRSGIRVSHVEGEQEVKVFGPDKKLAFSLHVVDPGFFRKYDYFLGVFFLFCGVLLVSFFLFGHSKKKFAGYAIWLPALVGLRLFFQFGGLPQYLIGLSIFSPALLALDAWNNSLAVFSLNIVILLLFTAWLVKVIQAPLGLFFRYCKNRRNLSFLLSLCSILLALVITYGGLKWIEAVVLNSRIYSGFSNIFQLDLNSIILFLAIFGLLVILYRLLRLVLFFPSKYADSSPWLISIWVALAASISYLITSDLLFSTVVAISISLPLALGRKGPDRKTFVRADFRTFLFLVLWLSVLTAYTAIKGNMGKIALELEVIASKNFDDRDLITESLFDRSLNRLNDQSLLLSSGLMPDSVYRYLPDWLNKNFFSTAIKGYQTKVYVYDTAGRKWGQSAFDSASIPIEQVISGEMVGEPTLSKELLLIKAPESKLDFFYAGLLELSAKPYGRLKILVELHPNQSNSGRLYPRLLVDEKMLDRFEIPSMYEYAIYQDGKLERKRAKHNFPFLYDGPLDLATGASVVKSNPGKSWVFSRQSENRFVELRFLTGGIISYVNVFCFVFYLFTLSFLLLFLPGFLWSQIKRKKTTFNLREKLLAIGLLTSIVPVIFMIGILSPVMRERFSKGITNDLVTQAGRIAGLLKGSITTACGGSGQFEKTLELEQDLNRTGEELLVDINLFDTEGSLIMTNQTAVYDLGLAPEYMNPIALQALRVGTHSEFLSKEFVGTLEFFSAYFPIRGEEGEILAFLNLPFLSRQDEVNAEIRNLVAYLVDIYALVLLITGLMTVLISNSIIRPLNFLKKRLERTRLGQTNSPLEWNTDDEIGDMIRSYNHMLNKLSESEKRLAQSQKEIAWKEMARQVAHEIKNPLTPMKLSLQHLSRAWKNRADNLDTLFEKVAQTLLVQIDSLVGIANSFSEFARMPEPKRTEFSLKQCLDEVVALYAHDEVRQIFWDAPEGDFTVNWDNDQISRVFSNLVKNALQAVEENKGKVTIHLMERGNFYRVSIEDNGIGIPPTIREKVFQPNFSTKSSGMGLGLAMGKQIVDSAGGRIWFDSEEYKGTTFFVELPKVE